MASRQRPTYGTVRAGSAGPEADGNGIGGSTGRAVVCDRQRQAHPGSRSPVSGGGGGGGAGSRRVEIRIWSCPLVAAPVRPPGPRPCVSAWIGAPESLAVKERCFHGHEERKEGEKAGTDGWTGVGDLIRHRHCGCPLARSWPPRMAWTTARASSVLPWPCDVLHRRCHCVYSPRLLGDLVRVRVLLREVSQNLSLGPEAWPPEERGRQEFFFSFSQTEPNSSDLPAF